MSQEQTTSIELRPIGWVESCYPDKFGTPRQSGLVQNATGKILLFPQFQPQESLRGLEEYSHIWVLFLFHRNVTKRFHASVHPPRLAGETRGVFATRSPHRPNPIGLSVCQIVGVDSDGVRISGLDLIDGTPVLDLKPYLVTSESIPSALSGWSSRASRKAPAFSWSAEAELTLRAWQEKWPEIALKTLIEDTLALDPRPVIYRGYEGEVSPYRNQHAVRIHDGDIHFKFLTDEQIVIHRILL